MVAVNRDRVCMASTRAEFEAQLSLGRTETHTATYYCTLDPHDPMDDHEAVTNNGPLTWWDPTEGEPEDEPDDDE